jgi:hypothetical protein
MESNIEFDHAQNLRLFSFKREGTTPSVILRDSANVGMFSSGAMRDPVAGGYVQVLGASDGILAAGEPLTAQQSSSQRPSSLQCVPSVRSIHKAMISCDDADGVLLRCVSQR